MLERRQNNQQNEKLVNELAMEKKTVIAKISRLQENKNYSNKEEINYLIQYVADLQDDIKDLSPPKNNYVMLYVIP
jgi:hypothetical protein